MYNEEKKEVNITKRILLCLLALCLLVLCGCGEPDKAETTAGPDVEKTDDSTIAAVVGEHSISAVELNYFYMDYISNFISQYSQYGLGMEMMMGEDYNKPIGVGYYDDAAEQTWADFFLEGTISNIKGRYAMYDAAKAAGYQLSEEDTASIDSSMKRIKSNAAAYGYNDLEQFLVAVYGDGADEDSYRAYITVNALATSYYQTHTEALLNDYTDADLRAFEKDIMLEFNSYTYASYYINLEQYKKGGTKDSNGDIIFSDEEIAQAEATLKAAAEALAIADNNTVDALNAAIIAQHNQMQGITDVEDIENIRYPECTENNNVAYSKINSAFQNWICDSSRKEGDIAALPYYVTSTDKDGNEVNTLQGYYVVIFQNCNDNTFALKNVRHILVSYEGGTTNESGATVYSEAEKSAAKTKAENLLKQWQAGEQTEDRFAALATEHTTDPGSKDTGGLYENIYPDQMVQPFNDWCFEENRQSGDTGIVQTDYGYHVMYLSGNSDMTYRDLLISQKYTEQIIIDWESNLMDSITVTMKNTDYINRDLVLGETTDS